MKRTFGTRHALAFFLVLIAHQGVILYESKAADDTATAFDSAEETQGELQTSIDAQRQGFDSAVERPYDACGDPCGYCGCGLATCDGCCDTGCCNPCGGCCCCPSWTVRADVLWLDRGSARSRTLLTDQAGNPVLDVTDHKFDMEAGPRVSLIYDNGCGWGVDVGYFGIDDWRGPTQVAGQFLLPGAPAGVVINNRQEVYVSELTSIEVNVRRQISCCTTLLAGFRWLQLEERNDILATGTLAAAAVRQTVRLATQNDLFGFQIGVEQTLWRECCSPLSIQGTAKAGVYHNSGDHDVNINLSAGGNPIFVATSDQSGNHTSFVGEVSIEASYQLTCGLSAYAGYQLMWLEGVALAPNQIQFPATISPAVDFDFGLFYHGAFAGLMFVH